MGEHYTIFDRVVTTHQRIYFDTTPNGKYLVSGGTDGVVQIWDLLSSEETTAPHSSFQANPECINGVRFVLYFCIFCCIISSNDKYTNCLFMCLLFQCQPIYPTSCNILRTKTRA